MKLDSTGSSISVVIPAFNRSHLLARALASVENQSLRPLETIVIDDWSTDSTGDVARQWGASVLRTAAQSGSGNARNLGIQHARGDWIAFLDSDDEWRSNHLALLAAEITTGRVLVTAPATTKQGLILGNARREIRAVNPVKALVPGNLICTSGTMVRRTALLDAGLFRDLRRAQDLDMWLRVLPLGEGIATGEPTVTYHVHDQQASKDRELTRACFEQIVADAERQEWAPSRLRDKAFTRWRWDDARRSLRQKRLIPAGVDLLWLAARPHVYGPLLELILDRRKARGGLIQFP
jgi:glycosyltransferase involved in cell wall biosynthesis